MSSKTKTYIAFDGDSDIMSYRTVQGWSSNQAISFNLNDAHNVNYARDDSLPESIISQLRDRLNVSKIVVLLVGDKTKYNRKGIIKYELNYALRNKLPIHLAFIGFTASQPNTSELWNRFLRPKVPSILLEAQEIYALVAPFTRIALEYSVNNYSHMSLPGQGYTWIWR